MKEAGHFRESGQPLVKGRVGQGPVVDLIRLGALIVDRETVFSDPFSVAGCGVPEVVPAPSENGSVEIPFIGQNKAWIESEGPPAMGALPAGKPGDDFLHQAANGNEDQAPALIMAAESDSFCSTAGTGGNITDETSIPDAFGVCFNFFNNIEFLFLLQGIHHESSAPFFMGPSRETFLTHGPGRGPGPTAPSTNDGCPYSSFQKGAGYDFRSPLRGRGRAGGVGLLSPGGECGLSGDLTLAGYGSGRDGFGIARAGWICEVDRAQRVK